MGKRYLKMKGRVFFDGNAVIKGLDRERRGRLSRAGAFVRTAARLRLRPARRLRLNELTGEQTAQLTLTMDDAGRYHINGRFASKQQVEKWKAQRKKRGLSTSPSPEDGRKRKLPFAPSRPGESPRISPGSLLKRLLFFSYDTRTESVVVGPEARSSDGAKTLDILEHGGRAKFGRVAERPFMAPALQQEAPKFPDLFADALR